MMRACYRKLYPMWGETEKAPAEHLTYEGLRLELLGNLWYYVYVQRRAWHFHLCVSVGLGYRAGAADLSAQGERTNTHNPTPRAAWVCFGTFPFLLPADFGN